MAFNQTSLKRSVPVSSREGGVSYTVSAFDELYMLVATSLFLGDGTFYEKGGDRLDRFQVLTEKVLREDPEAYAALAAYARQKLNLRSTPSAMLGEMFLRGQGKRALELVSEVWLRGDEHLETMAYVDTFKSASYPNVFKRALAARLNSMTPRQFIKYASSNKSKSQYDALNVARPVPKDEAQAALFKYAVEGVKALTEHELSLNLALKHHREEQATTWENVISHEGSNTASWEKSIPKMGYMACLAEGTPIWLEDGTTAPIEQVVAQKLPVLSYSKEWDTRPVRYGPNQPQRSVDIGELRPTIPDGFIDSGIRPVIRLTFRSGRVIEVTEDHRWAVRREMGIQSFEIKTTADLRVGSVIPMPLTANFFGWEGTGAEGYFVGSMLGDGGMTNFTPDFAVGVLSEGVVPVLAEFAAEHGVAMKVSHQRENVTRYRFTDPKHRQNAITDLLRGFEVWGKRVEEKSLPNRPFSREFVEGALSGLIDTDGHVRLRCNQKGVVHGSIEYCSVSEKLARQVSDMWLRLGVPNLLKKRKPQRENHRPAFIVSVDSAAAVVKACGILKLHVEHKAKSLDELVKALNGLVGKKRAKSQKCGYSCDLTLDKVKSIERVEEKRVYCVEVNPSNLFIANGIITGNCLRNLRNFVEKDVGDELLGYVAAKLSDEVEVLKSRQLPYRFLSALRALPSHAPRSLKLAVSKALDLSVKNTPKFPGRSLVMVDMSGSMFNARVSERSEVMRTDVAATVASVFGLANDADVWVFSEDSEKINIVPGSPVLMLADRIISSSIAGSSTYTGAALERAFSRSSKPYDRVVIFTDGQPHDNPSAVINEQLRRDPELSVYEVNIVGYESVSFSPRHLTISGFSSSIFELLAAFDVTEPRKLITDWYNERLR